MEEKSSHRRRPPPRSFFNNYFTELLCNCEEVCYVDMPAYSRVNATAGQSVKLKCNTSLTSNVMWTYENDDPYIVYVYWNGHLDSDKPQLSMKSNGGDFHSLSYLMSSCRTMDCITVMMEQG